MPGDRPGQKLSRRAVLHLQGLEIRVVPASGFGVLPNVAPGPDVPFGATALLASAAISSSSPATDSSGSNGANQPAQASAATPMSFADTRAAMLASSNASISSTPADSGQQSSTHVTSSLSADNSGNTSDAPGQNSKTNGQAATSSTANPNTALEAAIRGLTLPSSLSALMNRSAFTAASAPQTTDAIGAASPHSDRSQPSFEANSAAEPRSGDLFPTQAEDGNVNESDSRAMEALALMAQWRMALEEATLIAKATNDDDEEALAVVRDEAPAGLATKGAGFLEQFTPLDPGTMDQAVQRFLAQFQSKNEVRGGASSLQNLAVLTAAIGTALVGIEFIRRKRQRFHIPSFLSGSTYQSGIKSTRADRAWKKLSSYFAHRSSARRPA